MWHDTLRLEPTGGPGPVSRWKGLHVAWPRKSGLDRFGTFLRARPKDKEPPLLLANGRDRCDKHALRLLEGGEVPLRSLPLHGSQTAQEACRFRSLNSEERELLMDFLTEAHDHMSADTSAQRFAGGFGGSAMRDAR